MYNTLIALTLLAFSLLTQNAICQTPPSGPQASVVLEVGEQPTSAPTIAHALKDLSFQLLDLELDAGQMEHQYQLRTPFCEVVELDLLKWVELDGLTEVEQLEERVELMDELESLHFAMIDLEVELMDLKKSIYKLDALDQKHTRDNPAIDPEELSQKLDLDFYLRYQRMAQSHNSGVEIEYAEELASLSLHILQLESKVLVMQAAVAQREGYKGLVTMICE